MKRIIATVVFALIAVTTTSPSFAKDKRVAVVEEKIPQIFQYSSPGGKSETNDTTFMKSQQKIAVDGADAWVKTNYRHIRIISLSISGNYTGGGRAMAEGFSTVTILYVEK